MFNDGLAEATTQHITKACIPMLTALWQWLTSTLCSQHTAMQILAPTNDMWRQTLHKAPPTDSCLQIAVANITEHTIVAPLHIC